MNFFRTNKTKQEQSPNDDVVNDKLLHKIYSISEKGPVRETNEDAIYFSYPGNNFQNAFAMVADGMGGHNAGEIASKIACETTMKLLKEKVEGKEEKSFLANILEQANKDISRAAENNNAYKGMGTTAVMLLIKNEHATFAHVGDSRLYLYRDYSLQQLTTDHTLVNEMLKSGEITANEAHNHSMKNVITQALGTTLKIIPGTGKTQVKAGDKLLLCSDGVYDVLSNEELEAILAIKYPQLALETISALCMQRRTSDNFSVIIVVTEKDYSTAISITKEQNVML